MTMPTMLGAETVAPDTTSLSSFLPVADLGVLAVNAFAAYGDRLPAGPARIDALPTAQALLRVMALRPLLREYRILGCEADERRVALHLREDTPLDPAKVMRLVGQPRSPWKLTPDMKLTHHRAADDPNRLDGVDHVREVLRVLPSLCKDT